MRKTLKWTIRVILCFFLPCQGIGFELKKEDTCQKDSSFRNNGSQTMIKSEEWINEVVQNFSIYPSSSLEQLLAVQEWIKNTFQFNRGYGATIGQITSEEIYKAREIRGCHDIALIFSSTIRQLGYPCLLLETTSIGWSKEFILKKETEPRGHVFAEVFVDGSWILFDPGTGNYLLDYDRENPHLLCDWYEREPDGFYVLYKGRDSWEMGIYCLDDLLIKQRAAADLFKSWPSATRPTH